MSSLSVPGRIVLLLMLSLLSGCSPLSVGDPDEEKDPNFLAGKSRASSMDFTGAVKAFEKALRTNPDSAAAHLELGLLYESERFKKPATATYHFERHLELNPKSNVAEEVRRRIHSCKIELARSVSFAQVNRLVQDELERLQKTNSILRQQVEQMRSKLAAQEAILSSSTGYVIGDPPAEPIRFQGNEGTSRERTSSPRARANETRTQQRGASQQSGPHSGEGGLLSTAQPAPGTHVIRKGETIYSISKRYGLTVEKILSANRGLNPRKLKEAHTIGLPPGG
jgi:hypothetical protein